MKLNEHWTRDPVAKADWYFTACLSAHGWTLSGVDFLVIGEEMPANYARSVVKTHDPYPTPPAFPDKEQEQ